MFKISYIGSNIIENAPFEIDRRDGSYRYIFFHFTSSVVMELNGEKIEARPGSCILYEPNFPQHFYTYKNRLNHDYVDFTLEDASIFKELHFPVNTLLTPKMSDEISRLIKILNEEHKRNNFGFEKIEDAIMTTLLIKISRQIHHRFTISVKSYDEELSLKFEKIRLDLFNKPDNLDVSKLASDFGFSLTHFNYLYKKFFAVTPMQDLTKARVARVNELIKENVPTRDIIKTIGFESEEYFYRWFKKQNHQTKGEFIKDIKNLLNDKVNSVK